MIEFNTRASWLALTASLTLSACAGAPESSPGVESAQQGLDTAANSAVAQHREPPIHFTREQWARLKQLSPLPCLPPDPTNSVADDPEARNLGQALFFDKAFAGPLQVDSDLGLTGESGKVACASCHSGTYFDDRRSAPRTVSVGTNFHTRNAPPMVNSSFYKWTNWGGRFSAQWELPIAVVENGVLMNGNRLKIAHRIFDAYRVEYELVFGPMEPAIGTDSVRFPPAGKPKPAPSATNPTPPDGPWELMTAEDREVVNRILVNFGKALAAYTRALVSRESAFDRFVAGHRQALSRQAQLGAQLFVGKAGCVNCHSTSHFSDDQFHNLGVPQTGDHVPASDDGRFKDVPPLLTSPFNAAGKYSDDASNGQARLAGLTNPMPDTAKGAFRTPDLRGVAATGPYMHSGQLATLEDVVEFYDDGGGVPVSGTKDPLLAPLNLTNEEKAAIVEFLKSLSGEQVHSRLRVDTSAP